MSEIRVLLPVGEIPLGETVTKRTGEKRYRLADRLRVFGEQDRREIVASEGVRFLVNDGDANAVPSETVVCWIVERARLTSWLAEANEGA